MAIEDAIPGLEPTPAEQAVARAKLVRELIGRALYHIDCAEKMTAQAQELLSEA